MACTAPPWQRMRDVLPFPEATQHGDLSGPYPEVRVRSMQLPASKEWGKQAAGEQTKCV